MATTIVADRVLACGCELTENGQGVPRVALRCGEAEELWGELLAARDTVDLNAGLKGKKASLNAFSRARDAFREHMGWGP